MKLFNKVTEKIDKPTIAIDFDGVIHKYSEGWKNGSIYDEPMEGIRNALEKLDKKYRIIIFTTRTKKGVPPEMGIEKDENTVWGWLRKHDLDKYIYDITNIKPKEAKLFIDDRAIRFENWPDTIEEINDKINTKKSFRFTLFKGPQLNLFEAGGKEGDTKEGKGGTLKVTRDPSGKGAHWRLFNKKQEENNSKQSGIQIIDNQKAYSLLNDKLGNKVTISPKDGEKEEGSLELINENSDQTLGLFIKPTDGERKIFNIPVNQAVIKHGDEIIFHFADRNISVFMNKKTEEKEIGKQPYEMTRAEYYTQHGLTNLSHGEARIKFNDGHDKITTKNLGRQKTKLWLKEKGKWHRNEIEDAIKEGKTIPAEVLKDYPGLAEKKENKPGMESGGKDANPSNETILPETKGKLEKGDEVVDKLGRKGVIKATPEQIDQPGYENTYRVKLDDGKEIYISGKKLSKRKFELTPVEKSTRLFKSFFSIKQREKLADKHEALPDGSFPIKSEEDLKNAIQAVGRAKDYEKTKIWIKKRAKEMNLESLLPEEWT